MIWAVTSCSLINGYQSLIGTCCPCLQGWSVRCKELFWWNKRAVRKMVIHAHGRGEGGQETKLSLGQLEQQTTLWHTWTLEDGRCIFLQKVNICLHDHMVSQPRISHKKLIVGMLKKCDREYEVYTGESVWSILLNLLRCYSYLEWPLQHFNFIWNTEHVHWCWPQDNQNYSTLCEHKNNLTSLIIM
jgi:hypothetical protein